MVDRPVAGEDRVIDNDGIYLLDSGAQYRYVPVVLPFQSQPDNHQQPRQIT